MNDNEVDLITAKMAIKLKERLYEIGVVNWPTDPDLLIYVLKSTGDISLEYIYSDRVDIQNRLIELIASDLAKKIENAGLQLPIFGDVSCYPYYIDNRVGLTATYIYGDRGKKLNER